MSRAQHIPAPLDEMAQTLDDVRDVLGMAADTSNADVARAVFDLAEKLNRANAPRMRRSARTLEGYRVEYEIARLENKGSIMRLARKRARALAMATGQVVPDWVGP